MLAKANHMMPTETYRRAKLAASERQTAALRDRMEAENVVWWWDNYAHTLKRAFISKDKGTWTMASFTGMAFFTTNPSSLPQDLLRAYLQAGEPAEPIASMPLLNDMEASVIQFVLDKIEAVGQNTIRASSGKSAANIHSSTQAKVGT